MWIKALSAAALAASAAFLAAAVAPAAVDGGQVFQSRCAMCHSVQAGRNGVGPSLSAVASRRAGTVPGYNYSPALKASGIVWNGETLDRFLTAPQKAVPGTKMPIALADPAQRRAVILYLQAH